MIAEQLAAWGVQALDAPSDVRHAATEHLLDAFGTALGAVRTDAAKPAVDVALGLGGPAEATVIGTRNKVGSTAAALANGALVHALDFDDTHAGGLVHATSVVLPAAFAVGEEVDASGTEVLDAVIVGLETVCRVGSAAPYAFQERGLHATKVAGVFSAAIIASRLMRLSVAQTTDALGIAGSQAGGLLVFLSTGASTKQLHPGLASHAGVLAARLAAAGASGPANVFEGPHGLYDALAGGNGDPESIVADLGSRWETTQIGIKPYPACQLSHANIDAMLEVVRAEQINPSDIVSIRALTHPDSAAIVCDTSRDLARPATAYGAKFSLPWCLAAIAFDGELSNRQFTDQSIQRPEIHDLAAKVSWDLSESKDVAADAPGDVTVELKSGRVVVGSVARSAGGPTNRLTGAQLRAKFETNAGGSGRVIDLLERIDESDTVGPILEACAELAEEPRPLLTPIQGQS